MKKIYIIFLLSVVAWGESPSTQKKLLALEKQQKQTNELLDLTNQIMSKEDIYMIKDNKIVYYYKDSIPTIQTKPLNLTVISFQEGEIIQEINGADTVRWLIKLSSSGDGDKKQAHILIKPTEKNLITNLVVSTNKRIYYLNLMSNDSANIKQISFFYPQEKIEGLEKYLRKVEQEKSQIKEKDQESIIQGIDDYFENLCFNFKIQGDNAWWKPLRVYTNGSKTIIEFPNNLRNRTAPLLYKEIKGKTEVITFRVYKNKYIIDSLPDKLVLLEGTGGDQDRISIKYKGDKK